jgi:hypothetical protein
MRRIYVASSWRNRIQQDVVRALREAGHEVYDSRNPEPGNYGFQWSAIDPNWQQWTPEQYRHALQHPTAEAGYALDFGAMQWSNTGVLVLPCGASAHWEAGWLIGSGRELYVLLAPGEPELMRKGATALCLDIDELIYTMAAREACVGVGA